MVESHILRSHCRRERHISSTKAPNAYRAGLQRVALGSLFETDCVRNDEALAMCYGKSLSGCCRLHRKRCGKEQHYRLVAVSTCAKYYIDNYLWQTIGLRQGVC
jgi:hypothetical protein